MVKYRKLLILALLVAGLGAATAWLVYRQTAFAPATARLLPEGDILVYANLKSLHLVESRPATVHLEGEYRDFVDQTGIDLERDLDEVAMSRRDTPDGRDTESSEIFAGRFDQQRLKSYLEKASQQREKYRDQTVYMIPNQGHTVRVCILDATRVAVTNMDSAEAMHEIMDAARGSSDGPSLLQSHYRDVPLGSLAWMIDRVAGKSQTPQLPTGWSFDFLDNTIIVASLRYKGDLLFRADVIAPTENDARRVVESASSFLSVYRTVARSVGTKGTDPDVKAAIDSIRVEQKESTAVFTATVPQRMLKKLVTEAQSEVATPQQTAAPVASPAGAPAKKPAGRNPIPAK